MTVTTAANVETNVECGDLHIGAGAVSHAESERILLTFLIYMGIRLQEAVAQKGISTNLNVGISTFSTLGSGRLRGAAD